MRGSDGEPKRETISPGPQNKERTKDNRTIPRKNNKTRALENNRNARANRSERHRRSNDHLPNRDSRLSTKASNSPLSLLLLLLLLQTCWKLLREGLRPHKSSCTLTLSQFHCLPTHSPDVSDLRCLSLSLFRISETHDAAELMCPVITGLDGLRLIFEHSLEYPSLLRCSRSGLRLGS